jgi:hypothetical protein
MNYSELTQLLQDYLETSETSFVTNIPNFVRQAEERIFREVTIPDLRKNATGVFTLGDRYLSKPSDYLATFSMSVNDGTNDTFLLMKDQNFMREAYPSAATTGLPEYYAHFNDDFFTVAPTPASGYSVTLHYYYDPPSIVTASTSWLGDNAETVLLYGSLVEAYTYLKGDADMMQQYEKRYQTALEDLQMLGMLRIKRDSYREGELRIEA